MKQIRMLYANSVLLICMWGWTPGQALAVGAGSVPLIHSTDILYPPDDPDDYYDLAALFCVPEYDIKAVILDQGEKQRERPGRIAVEQLNYLTGRSVLSAVGLNHKLTATDDKGLSQPKEFQAGVETILRVLRESPVPVAVTIVGSLRDFAAAYNREPELLRSKISCAYVFSGEASDPKFVEWNVSMDPLAYAGFMRSGVRICWVPCFDKGDWKNGGRASFWQTSQSLLLAHAPESLVKYFVHATNKLTGDPIAYLDAPLDEGAKKKLFESPRNMWGGALLALPAGRSIAGGDRGYAAITARSANDVQSAANLSALFDFPKVEVTFPDKGGVTYGQTSSSKPLQQIRLKVSHKDYGRAMTSATAELYSHFPVSRTTMTAALPRADGYRGIYYMNQPQDDEYRYKYSGGFATYPQQHIPIAVYAAKANKTFFCYGGTVPGKRELLHMVSYYDHATGTVPRPVVLLNKHTDDAHDNPVLNIDDDGYIWIFSPSHGGARPCFIHRSAKPYEIESFTSVPTSNFSYPQPWHLPGQGFLFLHTRYEKGRSLYWSTSADGTTWTSGSLLARFGEGHYQISNGYGNTVATAFNFHPHPGGLNARTNLYYAATSDMGKTWRNVSGSVVPTPITTTNSITLVHDYQSEGLLVYLKDLGFDADGHPVILFLTSRGYESGPKNDPRTWRTARWDGAKWETRTVTTSDNNYDFGSLYIESDGTWRLIAPTDEGAQRGNPGGEVVMWSSHDKGANWSRERQLTGGSSRNHTYVRRPLNAQSDFYALWADGDARRPSDSSLFFSNRDGEVWKLPEHMTGEMAKPKRIALTDK